MNQTVQLSAHNSARNECRLPALCGIPHGEQVVADEKPEAPSPCGRDYAANLDSASVRHSGRLVYPAIISTEEESQKMGTLSGVVQQLRRERDRAQKEVRRIDAALAALGSVSSNGASRTMSAAGRRRISLAQKARWAKQRTAKPKRTISAAGRRRIAAAQRARWAKVKRAA